MKRLTYNRVAGAGMRANRRSYRSLALGIGLSIFLIASMCLCVQGVALAMRARVAARCGWANAFLLDSDASDEAVRDIGCFDRLGHIHVVARQADSGGVLGFYDAEAAALMNRRCEEGRLPEAPGEVAVERAVLARMRSDAAVGDELALELTPIDGAPERRSLTLVGILAEQGDLSALADSFGLTGRLLSLPNMLVCPDEPEFASGRTVLHRALTLSRNTALTRMLRANVDERWFDTGMLIGITPNGEAILDAEQTAGRMLDTAANRLLVPVALLGGALLLACCVGIAGALDGQLTRRADEVAMLRAVGATRRQIRRIFGRESWLLALTVAPVSILLSCLCMDLLARAFPAQLAFRPSPVLLAPIALLSVGCVLISSQLPLRRAARVPPAQALRGMDLMYRARRLRSWRRFSVPALMARRQFALHPLRHAGASLLIGLMIVVIAISVMMGASALNGMTPEGAQFELMGYSSLLNWTFLDVSPLADLNDGDLTQLASLPLVERVSAIREYSVNLMLDDDPPYFQRDDRFGLGMSTFHLSDDASDGDIAAYRAAQRALDTEKVLIPIDIRVMDVDADALDGSVSDGCIDLEALDSGREVLIYAPDYYMRPEDNGYLTAPYPMRGWTERRLNDFARAGQTLSWGQLHRQEAPQRYEGAENAQFYDDLFGGADSRRFSAQIGAVLQGALDDFWTPTIITTPSGAQSLGLEGGQMRHVRIWLSEQPDEAGEQALMSRIEAIALRGDMDVFDRIASWRSYVEETWLMALTFGAMAIILLATATGMVAGNVSRRIQADARSIGILRAVGADMGALTRTYALQVGIHIGTGVLCGAILFALCIPVMGVVPTRIQDAAQACAVLAAVLAFLLAILAVCLLLLRARIRELGRRSIVDNIREL